MDDRAPVYEANMQLLAKYLLPRVEMETWFHGPTGGNASRYLNEKTGKPIVELYDEYRLILNEIREGSGPPEAYLGVPLLFERIAERGGTVTVISSHPEQNLQNEIRQANLSSHIAHAIGSVTNKVVAIQDECTRAEVDPSQAAYTGDMALDIQAAHGAGVMAVAIAEGYHPWATLEAEHPHILVDHLTELLSAR